MSELKEINPKELVLEPFNDLAIKWALVCSGTLKNHNAMTIGWGGFGTLWRKNVFYLFIKPSRYTYRFIEENQYFVISLYDTKYHEELKKYGSLSGRSVNKDEVIGFTPYEIIENNVSITLYQEAKISFICKKIYQDDLKQELFLDKTIEDCYPDQMYHRMYIGEVVKIYLKEIDK